MDEWKQTNTNTNSNSNDTTRQLKRPVRLDVYGKAKENGLEEFSRAFGITAEEYAVNLSEKYRQFIIEDNESEATLLAEQFKCVAFPTAESVLAAARHLLATDIATNLRVRSVFRQMVRQTATVSVRPTEKGLLEIDEQHELFVSLIL